mgnify:CR=1 FL=1
MSRLVQSLLGATLVLAASAHAWPGSASPACTPTAPRPCGGSRTSASNTIARRGDGRPEFTAEARRKSAPVGGVAGHEAFVTRALERARAADSATSSFTVNGLTVIHRRVPANEVVAANLYLLGGTNFVGREKAGVELVLLETSERGTRRYPRDVLERKMARLGSAIATRPDIDWTMFALRSTVTAFDSTWAIFADRIMAPRLDTADVNFVRTQLLSGIAQRADDPDNLLEHLADSVAFAGHPYGVAPEGTAQSVRRLSAAELRAWHRANFVTSRMLLVVVGDVPRAKIEGLVRRTLATLPKGTYTWSAPPAPTARAGALHVVERALPTNYFKGYWPGPRADSPDYQAMRVAMAALGGRLFTEVRVRRNLTYAVEAPFEERAYGLPGLYVTTTQPDSVLSLMRREVTALKRGFIDPSGLQLLIQQFITEFFLDNETNSDQATFLARSQLYRGDWRTAERFVDELRRVTPLDIQRVSRTWLNGLVAGYVGDPTKISAGRVAGF